MVSWDDCAKRLDELGMYQRIVEESGVSSSKNALTVDLGCGRGYLLKELYKANPLMCTAGVDEKLGDCRRYLRSEKIPFSELASKKLVKKAPKLHGIYLVEENYRKIPKRAFDLSFMLFPSVTGYDMTGKDYDERLLATFMTCVQTLKRAILASNTAKIKSTVVIANLAGGGQASEYKRAGIFAKEKKIFTSNIILMLQSFAVVERFLKLEQPSQKCILKFAVLAILFILVRKRLLTRLEEWRNLKSEWKRKNNE